MRVRELMDESGHHWNIGLLEGPIQSKDIKSILRIPISSIELPDVWCDIHQKEQMRVGFGFAIRDNNGGFVVAGSGWLVEYYLPSLAELLGLKQLIVMLLYNKEGTSLSWVPRQANNLAHANEALLFMLIFLFG
ncbi:hypothetical protein GH714_004464 [Hevea brasiliensis]|uniref:Uncharacterized protein n=1 Tax=Hevea brasiliensis TaxID=3981 RepID=A0A6A6MWK4_HEVBR|nr:hypothetical protein GH714_004464 [Hevea brasiliensis]